MSTSKIPQHTMNGNGELMVPVYLTRRELEAVINLIRLPDDEQLTDEQEDELLGVCRKLVAKRNSYNRVTTAIKDRKHDAHVHTA